MQSKDTIEGVILQAIDHINKYQAETVKWRDRKVRLKNIKPRHLVLQRIANLDTVGKLQLKWERVTPGFKGKTECITYVC